MNARHDSKLPAVGKITLGQNLALLDRRLIERIDAEQAGRDDGLQHEMHEQFAEACLIQPPDVDGADRAAVFGEGLGGGAALRGNEVADCPAGQGGLAGPASTGASAAAAPARMAPMSSPSIAAGSSPTLVSTENRPPTPGS